MSSVKVLSLHIERFKRFRDLELNFGDEELGLPKNLVVLLGTNGCGKSTVLQAIASVLGTATRRLRSPEDLRWPGFDYPHIDNAWEAPPEVSLSVGFSNTELETISDCFHRIPEMTRMPGMVAPGHFPEVTLRFRDGRVEAASAERYFQFRGRHYARQVVKWHPEGQGLFQKVGSVFWYHEHRRTTSLTAEEADDKNRVMNENIIRQRLAQWQTFHDRLKSGLYMLRPGQRDFFSDLDSTYQKIFPGRSLAGIIPNMDEPMSDPGFFLEETNQQYELSELSGGERAVFPILMDFALLNINQSVILIDELELHLHPPLQQAFLRAIQNLGRDNQVILTTHSQSVVDLVPPESIIRLDD